jgi:hypothetical protein
VILVSSADQDSAPVEGVALLWTLCPFVLSASPNLYLHYQQLVASEVLVGDFVSPRTIATAVSLDCISYWPDMLTRCARQSSLRYIQRRHYSEQPPTGVPLNSPDGPTAEQMEQWAVKTFRGMSFEDQMKNFKRLMIRDVRGLFRPEAPWAPS